MLKTKKGFTLIELVVVMAIIAILSVIIVGAILAARTAATNTQRTGLVRTMETALEARAARCNGMYYAVVTAKNPPCKALVTTNSETMVTSLRGLDASGDTAWLSQDVSADDWSKVVFTKSNTNNYVITALDNTDTVIYTASR
jgi:prepilin-type N-terminal cleavage/methylation domain-containing protein